MYIDTGPLRTIHISNKATQLYVAFFAMISLDVSTRPKGMAIDFVLLRKRASSGYIVRNTTNEIICQHLMFICRFSAGSGGQGIDVDARWEHGGKRYGTARSGDQKE